jgi:hypothetical protein
MSLTFVAARAFAREVGVPWPPVGDVDIAAQQVRIAVRRLDALT